jgi:hypothetical protein
VPATIARPAPVVRSARRAGGVHTARCAGARGAPESSAVRGAVGPSAAAESGAVGRLAGRPSCHACRVRSVVLPSARRAAESRAESRPAATLRPITGNVLPNTALQPTALSERFSTLACRKPPSRLCYPVLGGRRLSFPVRRSSFGPSTRRQCDEVDDRLPIRVRTITNRP